MEHQAAGEEEELEECREAPPTLEERMRALFSEHELDSQINRNATTWGSRYTPTLLLQKMLDFMQLLMSRIPMMAN